MKKYYYSLPFRFKLWWAKHFICMLKDLKEDVVLYNELKLWIETEGKPQTFMTENKEN
jgi:hypothetical protein